MDPFEVRMQFLSLLRRLNASQQSIQKVVAYALKYFSRCGEDLWDCVVEECQKGSLNTRINILYLLDSLCEASLLSKASVSTSTGGLYVDYVQRDLPTIVNYVVPEGREGLINLMSAVQILENWRDKRILDSQIVEDVLSKLEAQKARMHAATSAAAAPDAPSATGPGESEALLAFSRPEIFKRIEEDRERHKRLRERRWVQPVSHGQGVSLLASFASLPKPATSANPNEIAEVKVGNTAPPAPTAPELPLDIEFDNAWETTSDWNEDDEEAILEENTLCYPNATTRLDGDARASKAPTPIAGATSAQAPETQVKKKPPVRIIRDWSSGHPAVRFASKQGGT